MKRAVCGAAIAVLALTGCSQPSDVHEHGNGVASISTAASKYRGLELGTPIPRPLFTLTDNAGQSYDFAAQTKGRPTLLYFGYTNCPDICPTTMADVAVTIRELSADLASQLQVVLVTTDPDRDTPPVLTEFLAHFDSDLPNRFIGLTGSRADVEAAQRAAKVPVAEDMGQTHTTQLQFYGPDDLARVVFVSGSSPDDLVHDLPLIVAG